MHEHFQTLYGADAAQRDHTWSQLTKAQQEAFCPNQTHLLCDPLSKLPSGKAGGGDGMPSQIIKVLSWQQIRYLAQTFEEIANNMAHQPHQRPGSWNLSLVALLAKKPHADRIEGFRPISSIPQIQKIYLKRLYQIVAAESRRVSTCTFLVLSTGSVPGDNVLRSLCSEQNLRIISILRFSRQCLA